MAIFLGMSWGELGAVPSAHGLITHIPWRYAKARAGVHVFPVASMFVEAFWRTEPPKPSGLHKRIMKYGKNPPYPGEHTPRPHAHLSLTNITGGAGEKTTGAPDVGVSTPTHLQRYDAVTEVCGTLVETVPTHTEFMAGPFLGCLYARRTGTTWDRS